MKGSSTATHKPLALLNTCFIILFLCLITQSNANSVKIFPLADEYFEKIYVIERGAHSFYLNVSCKDVNMLSVSITKTIEFQEHPRFNIYGTSQSRPKMGRNSYTFLKECAMEVSVQGSRVVQIRRGKEEQPFFEIDGINFDNLHNTVRVFDESTKWGLGERFQRNFRVVDGKWTLWNRDKPWKIDMGQEGISDQTYGFQPIYLARNNKNKLHHLVYFKNTYGLLIDIKKNVSDLTYNSVGGPIHFIVMTGQQDPEKLIERFHDYIGPATIPPFWAMGYHQCRWGYKTGEVLQNVLNKFRENDLPIDTIWSDLDYMDRKMIFTVNEHTHGGGMLNRMMEEHQVHFVPLIDAGVCVNDKNAMDMGKGLDVFLKDPKRKEVDYLANVWPGNVHFVDFLHPNGFSFWKQQLQRLYKQVQFSGIWLDMNEPTNFRGNQPTTEPFRIQKMDSINQMTINVDIPHFTQSKESLTHREVHTYYGHLSAVPIYEFLKDNGKRPFIISRSNSVGTGAFSGHWTGDNVANWQFLRLSISGNFLFQIFGIQMVGSDICGFNEHTTEELCARWYQVGAFYPFSRNHNVDNARDQEPYTFGQMLLTTSRLSLKTRYALLKHMYTEMVRKQGKGSFFRPLNFEFSLDQGVYEEETIETQFLIGKSLMVAPIVYQAKQERVVYFPGEGETWYNFKIDPKSGQVSSSEPIKAYKGKTKETLRNPLPSAPPTFLRSGYALLTNEPANRVNSLGLKYHMLAALKSGQSKTSIMAIKDYGYEPDLSTCIESGCFMELTLSKMEGNSFSLSWSYKGTNKDILHPFEVQDIVATEGTERWSYKSPTRINSPEGAVSIQMIQE